MDAKTRDLALLTALSFFCAGFAWAADLAVFGSVFSALGTVAILGAAHLGGVDMGQLLLKRANASRPSGNAHRHGWGNPLLTIM